jgi:uncharacterized membrane protein (GlpM family)
MNFILKLAAANAVIVTAAQIGKRRPSLSGLIATMPLTTVIVMIWLYADAPGDYGRMVGYTRGVLWGMLPSAAFFLAALFFFYRQSPLPTVLFASCFVWLAGAALHLWAVT